MGCGQQALSGFNTAAGGSRPGPNSLTPIFCCGFECGQLGSAGQHWSSNASASISTSTVRTGARSLRINTSATTGITSPAAIVSATHFVIRFYLRFAALPSADTYIAHIIDGGSVRYGLSFKQS